MFPHGKSMFFLTLCLFGIEAPVFGGFFRKYTFFWGLNSSPLSSPVHGVISSPGVPKNLVPRDVDFFSTFFSFSNVSPNPVIYTDSGLAGFSNVGGPFPSFFLNEFPLSLSVSETTHVVETVRSTGGRTPRVSAPPSL